MENAENAENVENVNDVNSVEREPGGQPRPRKKLNWMALVAIGPFIGFFFIANWDVAIAYWLLALACFLTIGSFFIKGREKFTSAIATLMMLGIGGLMYMLILIAESMPHS